MKKTIITIALCILAANVYAQEEQKSAKDRLSEIESMTDQIIPGKSKSRHYACRNQHKRR